MLNSTKSNLKRILMRLIALAIISIPTVFPMLPIENEKREFLQTFNLLEYDYKSASVLPIYTGADNKKYVILAREARGKDKYTYDDFSGGREREDENDPLLSAAREFHEEAVLQESLGWSLSDTINFIGFENNTIAIIAYSKEADLHGSQSRSARNVTYIINFDHYADTLFNNFYHALTIEKKHYEELGICRGKQCTTEKDRIAYVLLDDFKKAILHKKPSKPVNVTAFVVNPKNPSYMNQEQITLRPFLTVKLRPYFLNKRCIQGEYEKIKHYISQ